MQLGRFHGWNRIFLFYGLIFFLLGFAGVLFNREGFLSRGDWGFQNFTADLKPYTSLVKPGVNQEVAVLAPGNDAGVCFWHSPSFRDAGFEPEIERCCALLRSQVGPVIVKTAEEGEGDPGKRWAREYPGYVIIGLDAQRLDPAQPGYRIVLSLGMMNLAAPLVMEQVLTALADRPRITFQVQPGAGPWLEIAWQDENPGNKVIPVMTVVAELLHRRTAEGEGRSPRLQ